MGREIHPGELKVQAAQAVNLLNTNTKRCPGTSTVCNRCIRKNNRV